MSDPNEKVPPPPEQPPAEEAPKGDQADETKAPVADPEGAPV